MRAMDGGADALLGPDELHAAPVLSRESLNAFPIEVERLGACCTQANCLAEKGELKAYVFKANDAHALVADERRKYAQLEETLRQAEARLRAKEESGTGLSLAERLAAADKDSKMRGDLNEQLGCELSLEKGKRESVEAELSRFRSETAGKDKEAKALAAAQERNLKSLNSQLSKSEEARKKVEGHLDLARTRVSELGGGKAKGGGNAQPFRKALSAFVETAQKHHLLDALFGEAYALAKPLLTSSSGAQEPPVTPVQSTSAFTSAAATPSARDAAPPPSSSKKPPVKKPRTSKKSKLSAGVKVTALGVRSASATFSPAALNSASTSTSAGRIGPQRRLSRESLDTVLGFLSDFRATLQVKSLLSPIHEASAEDANGEMGPQVRKPARPTLPGKNRKRKLEEDGDEEQEAEADRTMDSADSDADPASRLCIQDDEEEKEAVEQIKTPAKRGPKPKPTLAADPRTKAAAEAPKKIGSALQGLLSRRSAAAPVVKVPTGGTEELSLFQVLDHVMGSDQKRSISLLAQDLLSKSGFGGDGRRLGDLLCRYLLKGYRPLADLSPIIVKTELGRITADRSVERLRTAPERRIIELIGLLGVPELSAEMGRRLCRLLGSEERRWGGNQAFFASLLRLAAAWASDEDLTATLMDWADVHDGDTLLLGLAVFAYAKPELIRDLVPSEKFGAKRRTLLGIALGSCKSRPIFAPLHALFKKSEIPLPELGEEQAMEQLQLAKTQLSLSLGAWTKETEAQVNFAASIVAHSAHHLLPTIFSQLFVDLQTYISGGMGDGLGTGLALLAAVLARCREPPSLVDFAALPIILHKAARIMSESGTQRLKSGLGRCLDVLAESGGAETLRQLSDVLGRREFPSAPLPDLDEL